MNGWCFRRSQVCADSRGLNSPVDPVRLGSPPFVSIVHSRHIATSPDRHLTASCSMSANRGVMRHDGKEKEGKP